MPRNPDKIDYSGGLPESFEAFYVIEDPRTGGNKKHHFGEVLFMAVTAMLCGMNGFAEIEEFCNEDIEWLKKWITLPNDIPRAQTFSNIFQAIDPDQFSQCLVEHLQTLWLALASQVIAVDGKALRGSHELNKNADHAVSAWAADTGMTLAQEFVTEKSNEITAIPKLLEKLDLKGHIVTIDAMGTHTHIAQLIVDKEADYILALKGNQGNSHKEVMDHFEIALRHLDLKKAKGWTISQDHEKAHGRETTRTVLATKNLSALDPEIRKRWPELKSLIVVENDTKIVTTGKERKKERRYYLSSVDGDAELFQKAIRQHWSIENNCHWVLDTCFREDHNQTCKANAAKNLGSMRRIVLNILKDDKGVKGSLPTKRLRALMNHVYRERLLSLA
jgi:predicted transposase YbfD/YdcC